jgi:hypothetical protein
MPDMIRVQVPGAFAEELPIGEFPELEPLRGAGVEVQAILTTVGAGAGLAADAATILLAKEAISNFTQRLRSWITRHAQSDPGSELIIEVSSRSPDAQSQLRFVFKGDADAVLEVDIEALASLLRSAFPATQSRE